MFFAHASKVKSNMSFLTACKFSQQVHSIWSWLQSLDVGWEWSRSVPLNGENLLWSFSVSNWVENGAHLAEKNPFWWTISVTSMLSEWTDFLSICLSVSRSALCGQTLYKVTFEFSYTCGFGILLPKKNNTVRKNCSSNREKLLKFKAEGRKFAEFLRSLEQFIQTVQGQNNFW